MYDLSVKNDKGEVLNLSSSPKYTIYNITGLTPPRATISSSSNSTVDGSSINNVRLESRNIVIYVVINGDIEANRIGLYKYFPIKKTITLNFKHNSRDVSISGVVELIECDLFSNKQVAQISIICPKPYFKEADSIFTFFSEVESGFEFPFSIDKSGIEFSSMTFDIRKSIINTGDVDTGTIIDIFARGTVVNPIIYNVLKNTHIRLNFTMRSSDRIVINTNVGEKSIKLIRDGVEYNALGYLSPDSDWFMLEAGDNIFTYEADNGTSNLYITFTTSILYGGV